MVQTFRETEKLKLDVPRVVPGIKALILDDSVFDRRRIRRLSHDTQLGIILDEISSLDALDAVLDQDRFDVILLDYHLPTGDGISALTRIREHPVNGDCPTIMVTGDDKSGVAVRSLKMGCNDYLPKDHLTADSLRQSIEMVISQVAKSRRQDAIVQSDIEKITAEVMGKYTNALQPKLARIIRDMRALKSQLGHPDQNLPGDLEKLERQCIQMWAVLLDPKILGGKQEFHH